MKISGLFYVASDELGERYPQKQKKATEFAFSGLSSITTKFLCRAIPDQFTCRSGAVATGKR